MLVFIARLPIIRALFMTSRLSLTLCGSLAFGLVAPLWGQGVTPRTLQRAAMQQAGGGGLSGGGTATGAASRRPAAPDELYLTAYRLYRESEQLAAAQSYNAAISKGQQAEKVLASIVRDHPGWKNNLVSTRRKMLAENLANYRKRAAEAPIPTGNQPGRLLPKGDMPLPNLPVAGGLSTPGNYRPVELPDYNSADKELYNALARAQDEVRRMAEAYRELDGKVLDLQKQLKTAELNQQMYKERYEKLQEQVATERAAGNQVVDSLSRQLQEMEARYLASEDARKQAEARVGELETQLAETQAELARVTRERDALKAENEQLRAIVELNSPEKTRALLDQNLTLAEQLKTAQARIAELESGIQGSGDQNAVLAQQLDEARGEANRLREEMSGIYDENMGYRRRISELSERLNNIEADLDQQEKQPLVDPALAEENKLLRDVIAKQRRTLSMQEEGRKLLIETYKQIKNQDPAMLLALKKLEDESSLDLTDAERRIMDSVKAALGEEAAKGDAAAAAAGLKAVRDGLEVETLANLAAQAFAKGRFTAAEQLYRTLYDAHPDHVAGLVNLGTILLNRNKCTEAADMFARASRLAPDLAITYFLAGISYYRMDYMEEARAMFARTLAIDPGNAEAFFYLANIEGVSGEYERALKHFAAAVKLKPGLADAHYNMARLYAETGKIPDAARAYDRSIHHGAAPDPAFEEYLRNHPDNAKEPGADLVEDVKPEDEAAQLRAEHPVEITPEGESDEGTPAEGEGQPAEGEPDSPDTALEGGEASDGGIEATTPAEPQDPAAAQWAAELADVVKDIQGAPTASPGLQHEVDSKRFKTRRIRTRKDGKRVRVKLRMKLPAPQRLRQRGGEIREVES